MNVYIGTSSTAYSLFKKSIDNGLTWITVGTGGYIVPYGMFVSEDESVVVLGTLTAIAKSSNGGVSFSTVHILPGSGDIQDLCVSPEDENYLFACGRYGYVYLSTNKGSTWSNVQLSGFTTANYLRGIHMVSNLVGWAVGRLRIYKTIDGGATWTEQKLLAAEPYDVWAVDENTVYVLEGTSNGVVWKTTDGGANWTSLATVRQYTGGRLCVRGANIWFTGKSGVNFDVVYSNDAGLNWNRVQVADTQTLNVQQLPITFADDNRGYVMAYHAYYSNDGGQTWSQKGIPSDSTTRQCYAVHAAGALSVEWRSFDVTGSEPVNRTIEGSVITADNPLNFGSGGVGDSAVKCLIFRAVNLGIYTTISNMRFYLQAKTLVGANSYYCDITDTWTPNKSVAQVSGGTPGTIPQTEPVANVTKIGGGNITGVGHADTSQYIYLAMNIGVDEIPGAKTLTYRMVFDYS